MKKFSIMLLLAFVLSIAACGKSGTSEVETNKQGSISADTQSNEKVSIRISDEDILVNGEQISEEPKSAVYKAKDIIFYLEDQGIAYGEGEEDDEHSQQEADEHTVIHITKPGTYEISGKMQAGQIFVDLGEDAEEDPDAVVHLVLNEVDISCSVAPAILFYNVYECGDKEVENASMDVDLTNAGANLTIADGSENVVNGSYVAKIYKSCELNEEGTEVLNSKKLHKYDAAVYSKMSMNVFGDTGSLKIHAENEGLDTELHLKIHGGEIFVESGNDGINVNEDQVSVFELLGGNLTIKVNGETGEGDGIDSNGWLLIKGGSLVSASCATSMDAGIDADNGIYIHGGTVVASGNMNAEIAGGEQKTVTFVLNNMLECGKTYQVKDAAGTMIMEFVPQNENRMVAVSVAGLLENENYGLWLEDTMIAQSFDGQMNIPGMGRPDRRPGEGVPEGMEPPSDFPEGMEPPEGFPGGMEMPSDFPEDMKPPMDFPEGMEPPEGFRGGEYPPEGQRPF